MIILIENFKYVLYFIERIHLNTFKQRTKSNNLNLSKSTCFYVLSIKEIEISLFT